MLLDLMEIPKIMEDEDIVGWLGSIASANGWDSRSFMSAFFSENIYTFHGTLSVVRDYIGIYKKYGRIGFQIPDGPPPPARGILGNISGPADVVRTTPANAGKNYYIRCTITHPSIPILYHIHANHCFPMGPVKPPNVGTAKTRENLI